MEYLLCIGLVVGLPVWFVVRTMNAARKQKALEKYAWSLQNWEHHEEGYDFIVNFPSMSALGRQYTYEYPATSSRYESSVRRKKSSETWQSRLAPEAHRARFEQFAADANNPELLESSRELAAAKLHEPNAWVDLPEDWQASLETAYQRYLRHT